MLQIMSLLQVIVYTAASKLENQLPSEPMMENSQKLAVSEAYSEIRKEIESSQENKNKGAELSVLDGKRNNDIYNIFLQLPQSDLRNLCSLLGNEG